MIVDRIISRMLTYLALLDWELISYGIYDYKIPNPTPSPASTLLCTMQGEKNPVILLRNHMSDILAAKI